MNPKTAIMKYSAILAFSSLFFATAVPAFAADSYQVTGPVLEVTDAKIVIQKDKEKWELARSADTKVTGELKVGAKVTAKYTMTATSIDVKPDKAAKPEKPAATPAPQEKKPK